MRPNVRVEYFENPHRNPIGWCCQTRNLFRGCSPVSEGCKSCYAIEEGSHQMRMRVRSPAARSWVASEYRWVFP